MDICKGFGKGAEYGQEIFIVTSLDDNGEGTLRDALSQSNRLIIFNVCGIIELQSNLDVRHDHTTILGHSAPGDGICIIKYALNVISTNHVIIRYLRIRPGLNNDYNRSLDAMTIHDSKNIWIDHISTSWGSDEVLSVTESDLVTISYCIISEPLNYNNHAYGTLLRNINSENEMRITMHNNLYCSCFNRTPRVSGYLLLQFENNVVYNSGLPGYCGADPHIKLNFENNYYKSGPTSDVTQFIWRFTRPNGGKIFLKGNYCHGLEYKNKDNIRLIQEPQNATSIMDARFDCPIIDKTSAKKAYMNVIAMVGTSHKRDLIDSRIIREVIDSEGQLITTEADVGGYPELLTETIYTPQQIDKWNKKANKQDDPIEYFENKLRKTKEQRLIDKLHNKTEKFGNLELGYYRKLI